MVSRPLFRDGHQRVFFLYDHSKHREEDDPSDAILYFYPLWADTDEQIALVGGLIATFNAVSDILQDIPSIISLTCSKFAVVKAGAFVLGLSADFQTPLEVVTQHLRFLWNTFCLFQGSLETVRQRSVHGNFHSELQHIWNSYFSRAESFSDELSQAFSAVPYRHLALPHSSVFLQASHILQRAQKQAGVLGGVLLNRNRVLCTQLSVDLTRHLLMLLPQDQRFPCQEVKPGYELPTGVRLLRIFLFPEELESLGPRKRSKQTDTTQAIQGNVTEDSRNKGMSPSENLSASTTSPVQNVSITEDTTDSFCDTVPELDEKKADASQPVDNLDSVTDGNHNVTSHQDTGANVRTESEQMESDDVGQTKKETVEKESPSKPTSEASDQNSSEIKMDIGQTEALSEVKSDTESSEKVKRSVETEKEHRDSVSERQGAVCNDSGASGGMQKDILSPDSGVGDENGVLSDRSDVPCDKSNVPYDKSDAPSVETNGDSDVPLDNGEEDTSKTVIPTVPSTHMSGGHSGDNWPKDNKNQDSKLPTDSGDKWVKEDDANKNTDHPRGPSENTDTGASDLVISPAEDDGSADVKDGNGTYTAKVYDGGDTKQENEENKTEEGSVPDKDKTTKGEISKNIEKDETSTETVQENTTSGAEKSETESESADVNSESKTLETEVQSMSEHDGNGDIVTHTHYGSCSSIDQTKEHLTGGASGKSVPEPLKLGGEGSLSESDSVSDNTCDVKRTKVTFDKLKHEAKEEDSVGMQDRDMIRDEAHSETPKTGDGDLGTVTSPLLSITSSEDRLSADAATSAAHSDSKPTSSTQETVNSSRTLSLDVALPELTRKLSSSTVTDGLLSPGKEHLSFEASVQTSESSNSSVPNQAAAQSPTAAAPSQGREYSTEHSSSDVAQSTESQFNTTGLSASSDSFSKHLNRGSNLPAKFSAAGGHHLEGREPVMLYVQGHMDTMLALVFDSVEHTKREIITGLWRSVLAKLADLDFTVNEAGGLDDSEAKALSKSQYLRFDAATHAVEGTAVQPVTSLANELVSSSILMHDSFRRMPAMQDILCRTHTTCCYGRKTMSGETFFQMASTKNGGFPDSADISFSLDQIADKQLYSDHSAGLL